MRMSKQENARYNISKRRWIGGTNRAYTTAIKLSIQQFNFKEEKLRMIP